jgi:pyridoxamine 5'-phosphate oxidase family protein
VLQPRGVEIRGRAEAISKPNPVIRIYPERIVGWGLDPGRRNARDVDPARQSSGATSTPVG